MSKEKLIPDLRFPEFKNEGEWYEKKLGEIATFLKGKGISKSDIVENGNLPCIRYGELYTHYNEKIDTIKSYSNLSPDELILSEANDVIIPASGETQIDIATASCVLRSGIAIGGDLNIIRSDIDGVFLSFYLNNAKKREIAQLAQGISVVHLYPSQLQTLSISIPKKQEQQKIASCLSSLDEVIAAHSQKLDLLKDHKKGLMQNLFPQEGEKVPKYRFKEFENDGEWVEKKLERYIDLFSGIALKSEELSDDESGVPILRGINITEGYIRHSRDIDKYFLGDLENLEKFLVKVNDIVIGMDGSKVGKNVAMITKQDENSILIQRVARIRANKDTDVNFVYQYFISDKFRSYVDAVNTSSGIPHISAQQIKDSKVGFPPKLKEQQKIASCLSSLDSLITAQAEKIAQLKLHKKGLMQGLFPKMSEL